MQGVLVRRSAARHERQGVLLCTLCLPLIPFSDHSGGRTSAQLFSMRIMTAERVSVGGFARTYCMHHSVSCS